MKDQTYFENAPCVDVADGPRDTTNSPTWCGGFSGAGHVTSVVSMWRPSESRCTECRCGGNKICLPHHNSHNRFNVLKGDELHREPRGKCSSDCVSPTCSNECDRVGVGLQLCACRNMCRCCGNRPRTSCSNGQPQKRKERNVCALRFILRRRRGLAQLRQLRLRRQGS